MPQRAYHSKITITNTLEIPLTIDLLAEIPQGSMPLTDFKQSKNWQIELREMSTLVKEFQFYFPEVGNFNIFPATITYNGQLVKCASVSLSNSDELVNVDFNAEGTFAGPHWTGGLKSGLRMIVSTEVTNKKVETMNDVLSQGNIQDILDFMKKVNLNDVNSFCSSDILWLLKDKSFYTEVIEILRSKHTYSSDVWSFSMIHGVKKDFYEYLTT